jgi:hypothetical protein
MDIAGDARRGDEVADLEGAQKQHEQPGGEVGQQSRPGHADGHADGRQDTGEARRLDPEHAEDGDDQEDLQRQVQRRVEIARQRRIHRPPLGRVFRAAANERDDDAADDPQRDGADQPRAERDEKR